MFWWGLDVEWFFFIDAGKLRIFIFPSLQTGAEIHCFMFEIFTTSCSLRQKCASGCCVVGLDANNSIPIQFWIGDASDKKLLRSSFCPLDIRWCDETGFCNVFEICTKFLADVVLGEQLALDAKHISVSKEHLVLRGCMWRCESSVQDSETRFVFARLSNERWWILEGPSLEGGDAKLWNSRSANALLEAAKRRDIERNILHKPSRNGSRHNVLHWEFSRIGVIMDTLISGFSRERLAQTPAQRRSAHWRK